MNHIALARKLRPLIEEGSASLDDQTASEGVELFPQMKYDGALIKGGTRINWNGTIKRAAVDLWDTEINNPDKAPSLWEGINYIDGYRVIPEVITSGMAFGLGERGWWNGVLYESLMAANVYTPDEYLSGWGLVE